MKPLVHPIKCYRYQLPVKPWGLTSLLVIGYLLFVSYTSVNDGDLDTYTEGVTLPESGLYAAITREEIQREFARAMAERLVHAALLAGAKDNITVMVVLLPACGL